MRSAHTAPFVKSHASFGAKLCPFCYFVHRDDQCKNCFYCRLFCLELKFYGRHTYIIPCVLRTPFWKRIKSKISIVQFSKCIKRHSNWHSEIVTKVPFSNRALWLVGVWWQMGDKVSHQPIREDLTNAVERNKAIWIGTYVIMIWRQFLCGVGK